MTEAERLANIIHCGDDQCKCSSSQAAALLRKLQAENEALQADLVKHRELLLHHLSVIDPLRVSNDKLTADAKRLDWLERNAVITYGHEATVKVAFPLTELPLLCVTLWQTVDEAMKGETLC
jgi:hypothetical protein